MLQVAENPVDLKLATEGYAAAATKMVALEVKVFTEVAANLRPNQLSKTVEAFALMAGIFNPPTPRAGAPARRGGGNPSFSVASVMSAAPAAMPQRGGGGTRGGGGMGGFSAPSRLNTIVLMFSLSEDQKKAVKKILDDDYRAAVQLRATLASAREPIGIAIRDNQEASLAGAIAAYPAAAAEMATAEMKALAKVVSTIAAVNAPEGQSRSRRWRT